MFAEQNFILIMVRLQLFYITITAVLSCSSTMLPCHGSCCSQIKVKCHQKLYMCKLNLSLPPQYVLKPTFTKQHIAGLDKQGKLYRAYDGTTYLPGIVGLNNIKANDYANVVLQAWITGTSFFFLPGPWHWKWTYLNCFLRPFPMSRPCGTIFWRRRTTGKSAGRPVTSCSCLYRGLANSCVNFGIQETSRPTCLLMRCYRLWCCAARKTSKSPSRVKMIFLRHGMRYMRYKLLSISQGMPWTSWCGS